ncbi:hypothetical protein H704_00198 [Bartonella bacilliformis Peru38]|nr:hypothetical protein X472_00753 [Bartonella bacilliformis San Pedro600-02]KEG21473.1 hypothetical protein H704_00198 [Bartonella bacilliformis Peru38]KEG24820.1 hypothetical protein H708_00198 [Bartonella bacilliformis VAB9028]
MDPFTLALLIVGGSASLFGLIEIITAAVVGKK